MIATQDLVVFRQDSPISAHTLEEEGGWLETLLADQEWDISQGRYATISHMSVFYHAQKINVKQLKLRWTGDYQVLANIRRVAFPHLKQLFLNGNSLVTLEPITEVYMPSLQVLNLKQNEITRISPLRKCHLPNLRELSLYKNRLCDPETLTQLAAPKLAKIWLNARLENNGNAIVSISWLAKLQSTRLSTVIVGHRARIEQEQVKTALEAKVDGRLGYEYVMRDDRELNWL